MNVPYVHSNHTYSKKRTCKLRAKFCTNHFRSKESHRADLFAIEIDHPGWDGCHFRNGADRPQDNIPRALLTEDALDGGHVRMRKQPTAEASRYL
jgi:hypothetical protein